MAPWFQVSQHFVIATGVHGRKRYPSKLLESLSMVVGCWAVVIQIGQGSARPGEPTLSEEVASLIAAVLRGDFSGLENNLAPTPNYRKALIRPARRPASCRIVGLLEFYASPR